MTRASDTARILSGGAVINEDSNDVDLRVESNGEANMLLVDGGNDRVVMSKSSSGASTFPLVLTNPPDNNANTAVGLRLVPSNATIGDRTVDIVGSQSSDGGNAMELKFLTSNGGTAAERMRINSSGHVLVGGTTLGADNSVSLAAAGTVTIAKASSGGTTHLIIKNGGSQVGSITSNTTTTFYNTSSDYRLKENVVEMSDATSRLKQLKPCRFNFIADADTTVDGFIAHEVSSIVPEAIFGKKDAVDEDGNIDPQGIDQSKLVPLLVKTIQELEARIATLESK